MFYRLLPRAACVAFFLPLMPSILSAADCGPTRYDCAVYYVTHHELATAIRLLNEELQQSPGNLKALNLLGIALTESGQPAAADGKFKQALAIDPEFYPARKNLAINEFNKQHLKEAEADLSRVLKKSPDDEVAHIYLAEIDFRKGEFSSAVLNYKKARVRVAQNPLWTLHYAESLVKCREVSQAAAVLQSLPEGDGDARFKGGLILGEASDYANAAMLFASAAKNYPDPYLAGYNEILMLIRAENYADAIKVFHQMIDEGYGRAELYNLASDAYLKAGDLKQAYDSLRTATKLEPKDEENYVDLAALCLDDQDYDLALEVLDVGTHYVPSSYRLYVQRGFTLVMKGRTQDAEKEFLAASELAPDKSLPYIALGEVWMQIGQAQKAADILREKSKLAGADFLIPYVFAEALVRSGADAGTPAATEAIAALQKSIQLNPKFAHAHAELGKLLLKEGKTDRAIPELKLATELDPNDSGPFYQLGQAYRKTGQKAEADQMLARVAELHSPEHELDMNRELRRLVKQDTAASETKIKP